MTLIAHPNTVIHPLAVVDAPPEHLVALQTWLNDGTHHTEIHQGTIIREFATVHAPTGKLTCIGENCFLMTKTHVGHDCILEDHVILAVGAVLGGHCHVFQYANIGLNACVHQYRAIGAYAMVGMGAIVVKDVPPFAMIRNGKPRGVNIIGMERNGFSSVEINEAKNWLLHGETPKTIKLLELIQDWEDARV